MFVAGLCDCFHRQKKKDTKLTYIDENTEQGDYLGRNLQAMRNCYCGDIDNRACSMTEGIVKLLQVGVSQMPRLLFKWLTVLTMFPYSYL